MLGIETLHHVSISVTDLARAKRFYGDVLGLMEIPRPAFDFAGAWYELGDRQVHLIVHTTPRSLRGTTEIDPRDGHFAIRVRSHRETLAHLQAHGVAVRDNPRNATPWEQIHVTDPDGNVIELNAERKE
jgi:catechol 2,3-dioxygenase-like lactoylglutathione lyase family enzyme